MARSSTSFKKGAARPSGAGRKKGTPNKVITDIKELAQGYGPEAIATLVELMRDADFETVRVSAAKELLDRAYGKAIQPVDATVVHNIIYEVVLDFGEPAQVLQGGTEVSATIQGPARNGQALGHNGRAS